jgi:hypothetical protein
MNAHKTLACLAVAVFLYFGSQTIAIAANDDYGPEQILGDHYGVTYSLRCENCNVNGSHMWWVRFRNNGSRRAAFDFQIAPLGTKPTFSDRVIVEPGKTAEGWNNVENSQYVTPTVYTANWTYGPDAR